jgi:hypothetical protein
MQVIWIGWAKGHSVGEEPDRGTKAIVCGLNFVMTAIRLYGLIGRRVDCLAGKMGSGLIFQGRLPGGQSLRTTL